MPRKNLCVLASDASAPNLRQQILISGKQISSWEDLSLKCKVETLKIQSTRSPLCWPKTSWISGSVCDHSLHNIHPLVWIFDAGNWENVGTDQDPDGTGMASNKHQRWVFCSTEKFVSYPSYPLGSPAKCYATMALAMLPKYGAMDA